MRHALITAGSKGLGRKVTEALLEKGYSVTVNYRQDEEAVRRLKEKWRSSLDRLQFVKGDVTRKEDLLRMVNAALCSRFLWNMPMRSSAIFLSDIILMTKVRALSN